MEKYQHIGGIGEEAFCTYYRGITRAVAIEIENVTVLSKPLRLEQLYESSSPPQSFKYLSRTIFRVKCCLSEQH